MTTSITATYRIATPLPLERAAEIIAGEQSAGTFTRVAFESDQLLSRHAAVVESITPEGELPVEAALPGVPIGDARALNAGVVRIAFPAHNFGPSLASVVTTVAGNLYELRDIAGIKLLDVEIPAHVAQCYSGPRHGIAGTRRLIGAHENAMIGTIVKPSIGLTAEQLQDMVAQLGSAGIDFIKDDEVNSNAPYFPLNRRIDVVLRTLNELRERTGRAVMYAFNITGDLDDMKRAADRIARSGGTCAMVAVPSIGLSALAELRRSTDLVIHGHRAGFGALDRSPRLGQSFRVFQKLASLAGVDHLHVGGINSKFWESNQDVADSVSALRDGVGRGEKVLPVLSSAQTAATAGPARELLGSDDLLVLAGGGIHAHPGGIADGVQSMREAWRLVAQGRSPAREAQVGSALHTALQAFGE